MNDEEIVVDGDYIEEGSQIDGGKMVEWSDELKFIAVDDQLTVISLLFPADAQQIFPFFALEVNLSVFIYLNLYLLPVYLNCTYWLVIFMIILKFYEFLV